MFESEGSYLALIDSPEMLADGTVKIAHTGKSPNVLSFMRVIIKSFSGCELYEPKLLPEQQVISDKYLKENLKLRVNGVDEIKRKLRL